MVLALACLAIMLAASPVEAGSGYKQLPATNDWQTAVEITQRVFPGSRPWLLSCSASEGGHGSFKYNRQGSGAGGWMQFMRSTFESNVNHAIGHAKRHGFKVPPGARSYYSPLGQALTGGYMWYRGWTHHWYGAGC